MLARLLYGLGAATGGSLLSQFPEYYIHYVQRLGGRVDQARLRAAEIREDAATMGLSVEDYVASFLDSAPHSLEGARMTESIFQLDRMEAAYHALRAAPALERPLAFVEHMNRSEEHTSELQSLMRISYAVFCLKKKKKHNH